ncbi:MAG TPA: hypothetical protein VMT87_03660 [Vicinamibacteria bacterium]|nr:hypothetical protein [Vicinamibacteria bacterium]
MRHPSPGALLELHFEECAGAERDAVAAHIRACPPCAAPLEEIRRLEQALAVGPDDGPPADGLERVLARVAAARAARTRPADWARAVLPGAAALLAGSWAIRAGAERLSAIGLVRDSFAGLLSGDLLGLALAALGVLGAGALVTLALAPVLILESHGRSSWTPRRS